MKKYIAYYAAAGDSEEFDTIEEAKDWLVEYDLQGEIAEETIDGYNYIAEIKLVSHCPVTHRKEDYKEGEWPYDPDFDTIHDIQYVKPEDRTSCAPDSGLQTTNNNQQLNYASLKAGQRRLSRTFGIKNAAPENSGSPANNLPNHENCPWCKKVLVYQLMCPDSECPGSGD
jgi:hypothetical protein